MTIRDVGEEWVIEGRHPMRRVTTRTFDAGLHRFEVLVNGRKFPAIDFELEL